MKKNGGSIACVASRDYVSSMPARYIPKKFSDRRKAEEKDTLQVRGPVESEVYDNPNATAVRSGFPHGHRGRTTKNASYHKETQNENGKPPPTLRHTSLMLNSMPMSSKFKFENFVLGFELDALQNEVLSKFYDCDLGSQGSA